MKDPLHLNLINLSKRFVENPVLVDRGKVSSLPNQILNLLDDREANLDKRAGGPMEIVTRVGGRLGDSRKDWGIRNLHSGLQDLFENIPTQVEKYHSAMLTVQAQDVDAKGGSKKRRFRNLNEAINFM